MSLIRLCLTAAILAAPALTWPASAQFGEEEPDFPTTEFADDDATSASVTADGVTAGVSMARRPEIDRNEDVPVLTVTVGGQRVLEAAGVPSGMGFPAAEASIAEIDPTNATPEVYFSSYSGGAHCCSSIVVASEVGGRWAAIPVGEFDGDANYLEDLDGDGVAEIATVDNRFLYKFDCYACSAAPLQVTTVRSGKVVDISADPRFLPAHRHWLAEIEAMADPQSRWSSPGFLAGWVAAKIRVGQGEEALAALEKNWDRANDPGQEVCSTGGELEECSRRGRVVLQFPDQLRLFLQQTGYLR